MLKIENMLSETRSRIEQTKGRVQYLERTSEMSLIDIYLVQDMPLKADFTASTIQIKEDNEVYFNNETTGGSAP